MWSHSISLSVPVLDEDDDDTGRRVVAFRRRSEGRRMGAAATRMARSSTLRSSRMLPGHEWATSASIASASTAGTGRRISRASCGRSCSTRFGMSSLRWRSAGQAQHERVDPGNRGLRGTFPRRPARTISSCSPRRSGRRLLRSPSRSPSRRKRFSSTIFSSFGWMARSVSPTSSRKDRAAMRRLDQAGLRGQRPR